jgi:hypothetical protein
MKSRRFIIVIIIIIIIIIITKALECALSYASSLPGTHMIILSTH